jgi:hypothetical protein
MKPRSPAPEERSLALADWMIGNHYRTEEMCQKPCGTGFLGRWATRSIARAIRQNLFFVVCKLLLLKKLVSFSIQTDGSCHSQYVQ